jgi:GDP-D-mannose dehydratase
MENLLVGDPTKAREKLVWEATTSSKNFVRIRN